MIAAADDPADWFWMWCVTCGYWVPTVDDMCETCGRRCRMVSTDDDMCETCALEEEAEAER